MHKGINPTSRTETAKRRRNALLVSKAERNFSKNDLEQAIAQVQLVLAECSDHLAALELHARILWKQQDFKSLVRATDRLISLNPFEPGYHSLRGMSLRALGMYGEAAKALERDPSAAKQLIDLECFQAALIKDTIKHDQVFASKYAKDPVQALTEKGFYFKEREAALAWVSQQVNSAKAGTQRKKIGQ
jgi:tetratricopeptide (TPR) repeat protein